jgi:hypothetical protein
MLVGRRAAPGQDGLITAHLHLVLFSFLSASAAASE